MPNPAPERNLLFGMLALQLNLIDREAMIAGMRAWVADKSRTLGEILVVHSALNSETRTLIDALVNKHLELHNGDPQQSLNAVSSLDSLRMHLEQIGDEDLYATIVHFPVGRRFSDDTNSLPPDSSESGSRFRILRPHARGGLGEVFVAHDEELNRDVALKQIQGPYADHSESRARFVREAEITGALEHPGIVPVYGLGAYADGRPYYAMRFIQGNSLGEAINRYHDARVGGDNQAQRSLEFRQLLQRLIDVCNTIDYAHSRGVLHRDLKPGNIMLGKYGETLVVDWGLAKACDDGQFKPSAGANAAQSQPDWPEVTAAGVVVGTPAYMSPEQAAGQHERLGSASDVYSLGATLYHLLTGRAPFGGSSTAQILQRVQDGDFPPPRELAPTVPGPLEAICLKAMAHDRQYRYASPRALADDIEHWLADEPVTAYRESLTERVMRTVNHSRYDHDVGSWSQLLLACAGIILAGECVQFMLHKAGPPYPALAIGATRSVMLLGLLTTFLLLRRRSFLPGYVAERALYLMIPGFVAVCSIAVVVNVLQFGWEGTHGRVYADWCVASAMLYIALGSLFWGRCLVFAAVFVIGALTCAAIPWLAALVFGAIWAGSLFAIGIHLRRQAAAGPRQG